MVTKHIFLGFHGVSWEYSQPNGIQTDYNFNFGVWLLNPTKPGLGNQTPRNWGLLYFLSPLFPLFFPFSFFYIYETGHESKPSKFFFVSIKLSPEFYFYNLVTLVCIREFLLGHKSLTCIMNKVLAHIHSCFDFESSTNSQYWYQNNWLPKCLLISL